MRIRPLIEGKLRLNMRLLNFRSMKWKPPSENSIDFKLVLRFPALPDKASLPDYYAKPIFQLHTWCGGKEYALYDVMEVTDEEWERCAINCPYFRLIYMFALA